MATEEPLRSPSPEGENNNNDTLESPSPASSSQADENMKKNGKAKVVSSNAAGAVTEAPPQGRSADAAAVNNDEDETPPSGDSDRAGRYRSNGRSIQSSIVIRQTEETLQTLQRNLRVASHDLLQSLARYLSGLPATGTGTSSNNRNPSKSSAAGGISLPASAVGWLASELQTPTITTQNNNHSVMLTKIKQLLPRLRHLRITAAPWPPVAPVTAVPTRYENAAATSTAPSIQQQHQSLQYLHRLRYSPRVNVSIFPNCQVLLFDQVPPEWVIGLPCLANSLQVLRVERACLYDLEDFLLGNTNNNDSDNHNKDDDIVYFKLTHLKLSHCSLGELTRGLAPPSDQQQPRNRDSSNTPRKLPLARLPQLVSLSLSHNDIQSEASALGCGISEASKLSMLDLSYNRITALPNAPLYLGNIQTLLLTGNQMESADGLDSLYALHTLALDNNKIEEWMDVSSLARLPELKTLKLKGNPLMESSMDRKNTRVMLLDLFREQRWGSLGDNATFRQLGAALPVLDGKPATNRELKALQQRAFPSVPAIILPRNYNRSEGNDNICTLPIGAPGMTIKTLAKQKRGGEPKRDDDDEEGKVVVTPSARGKRNSKTSRKRTVAKANIREEGMAQDSQKPASMPLINSTGAHSLCRGTSSTKKDKCNLSQHQSDEEKEELLGGVQNGTPHGEYDSYEAKRELASPKVSFSIQEVLSSLTPSSYEDAAGRPKAEKNNAALQNPEKCQAQATEHNSNTSYSFENGEKHLNGDADPVSGFEWPKPLAYVPEQNLYGEFEFNLMQKKPPKKKKRRKDKSGKAKKLGEEAALTIQQSTAKSAGVGTSPNRTATARSSASDSNQNGVVPARAARPAETKLDFHNSTPKTNVNGSSQVATLSSGNTSTVHGEAKIGDTQETNADEVSLSESDASAASRRAGNRSAGYEIRSVSSDGSGAADLISPRGSVAGAFFPAMAMAKGGDDATSSSIETSRSSAVSGQQSKKKSNARSDNFILAEVKSKFLGLEHQRQLKVLDNLELYFKTFVFPELLPGFDTSQDSTESDSWRSIFFRFPRIQLLPKDRELREANRTKGAALQRHHAVGEHEREQFVRVWRENIVACGKPALRRLPPNRSAHYGFHGELTWVDGKVKTVSDCRQVILCLSNTSFYVILDNDTVTTKEKAATTVSGNASQGVSPDSASSKRSGRKRPRKYPSPIEEDATFEQALWPHSVACHALEDLQSITIGFGFQRMTLRFRNTAYPSAVDFTYLLVTSNKMQTVALLQELQGLVKEVKMETTLTEDPIKIDNDDKVFLDALSLAVAPDPLGAVLHYQIVKQRWKHGQRGAVSRACVVTDSKIFLLDEDYTGDGSKSVEADSSRRLGSPFFSLVDGADLQQVAEVQAADADPNAITIVIRPTSSLLRTHRWRLLCRDRTGAERLVEDVRKGMSLVE